MAENLEPGFYQKEDGTSQYWDGTQWLKPVDTPPPAAGKRPVSRTPIYVAAGIFVVGVGGFFALQAISESQAEAEYQEQVELLRADHNSNAARVKSFFRDAVSSCSAAGEIAGVEVGDDYLTIDVQGDKDIFGASYLDYFCLVGAVEVSPVIEERMGSTRALDGTQTGDWDVLGGDATVSAEWKYHPNSGPGLTMAIDSEYLEAFAPPQRVD